MAIIDAHKDELTAILKLGKGISDIIPWIQLTTQNAANDTCAFYAFFDDTNTNTDEVLALVKSSFCAYFWPEGHCHVIAQRHTKKRTTVNLVVVVTASETNTESTGLTSGAIAAIIICTLLILAIILVVLYLFVFKKKPSRSVGEQKRPEYA